MLLAGAVLLPMPAAAIDCVREAETLARLEGELPDPSAAPANDRQLTCISLEVNVDFAARLAALARDCPASEVASRLETHRRRAQTHARVFAARRCRRTILR